MVIAVGDPKARKFIATRCNEAGAQFASLVHHSVEMSEFVEIGAGSIICCGTILTVNIKLGCHVHVNLDCTIGHDVHIGDFSTLSPGVHVSGNVHIGEGVYIGTGANIINGISGKPLVIADGTVIGAGACVTKSAECPGLYAGVPAQLKKSYR
jgi:sugar O-acyltransferase (sialic acid O-acetyltransferase NeuD family)